ncbi:MAG TPA: SBBP repeat-containing protein, partial [Bacteroidia bacterium]|nr:SBBP repeat-containing protein [Bacteroidia bacterium]
MKIPLSISCFLFLISVNLYGSKSAIESDLLKSGHEQLINAEKTLCFEENKGQIADINGKPAPYVLFRAAAPGLNIYITESGLTYQFYKREEEEKHKRKNSTGRLINPEAEKPKGEWKRVDMILNGASIKKENVISEEEATAGGVNYYFGHCPDGIFNVKTYTRITITNIYPEIDWVLSASGKGIKHDFILHPGADAKMIKLIYEGSGKFSLNDHQLYFENELGNLTEGTLLCYQGSLSNFILSHYTIKQNSKKIRKGFSYEVGIQTGAYDTKQDLIIDPPLLWGTYYGGFAFDGVRGVATDGSGNLFVAGYVNSSNFLPTNNPGGGIYYQGSNVGGYDIFLMKFNANGTLLWSTYYGGTGDEAGLSLATDNTGNVYMTGYTTSADFPTLNPGGGAYYHGINAAAGAYGVFILKFSNSGTRLWGTYYGDGVGTGSDLCTDAAGNLFIAGYSEGSGMPVADPGGGAWFQGTNAGGSDVFILKFTNTGALNWATYYGGTAYDLGYSIDNDASGNVFVTGYTSANNLPTLNPGGAAYYQPAKGGGSFDAFLLKFSNNGNRIWATYYGGNGDEFGNDVAIDGSGNLFVTGSTSSANFPTQNSGTYYDNSLSGWHDIYVLKFSNAGARQWGTLYGGSGLDMGVGDETGYSITTDFTGNVFVTGYTSSTNFPTLNPGGGCYFKPSNAGGAQDSYIIEFDNNGTRLWATYNGTNQIDFGTGLVTGPAGNLFAVGEWQASGSNGLNNPGGGAYYSGTFMGGDDSYIMKFGPPAPLPVELVYFKAECNENKNILLKWQTASETNNDYFSIERSNDGDDFETIGIENGAGNSTTITSYSFVDDAPLEGISYYRLQQTDYNEKTSFSKVIALHNYCNKVNDLFIYPNPAN